MVITSKNELRQSILELINQQKEEELVFKSRIILDKFLALPVFKKARVILFYASLKGEVDTWGLIEKALEFKKSVLLPLVQKEKKAIIPVEIKSVNELKKGAYGISEPCFSPNRVLKPSTIDLVVVPGMAFDHNNNRLGRGAGYYDRFLKELPPKTPTIGLAFDFQVVSSIPGKEAHDQPVSLVLTN
ncbi:MAG: 5-formyltetrahydrofolate cyclo-ligase [Candidatus Omnitrophica bacterium]|nr:5-formyltetrahydrofolate cyclo-ligase [Candidatus Omnitrophota bacterium]